MNAIRFVRNVMGYFNMESELENKDFVYEEIKKGVSFKGTNLWILIFAIIVASVGLNVNSTAVIIGAMLISPLMGPINAMGYSIATYDGVLFRKSVKNYTFAIVASLSASTLFFLVSPISTAHSELLARTSPTIYDVLIALFGGLAGIVAICSKQKGNVIPGVAIATALMPPLCTAGYGLASGKFEFFFGAMYLFTINTFFIAMASVWIAQLLKFPIRSQISDSRKRRINRTISSLIVVVLLPSIYFGYNLIKQEDFLQRANQYISNVSQFEGNYLLDHSIDVKKHAIVLVYGGMTLQEHQKASIVKKAADFELKDAVVSVEQGLAFSDVSGLDKEALALKEQVSLLSASLDSARFQKAFGEVLLRELKAFFPQVSGGTYAESLVYHDSLLAPVETSIFVLSVDHVVSPSDKEKIRSWLMNRLQKKEIKVIVEE